MSLGASPLREADELDDRKVVVIDRDAALVLRVPHDLGGLGIGRVDARLVVGDAVVAELVRDAEELSVGVGVGLVADTGEDVVPGYAAVVQGGEVAWLATMPVS